MNKKNKQYANRVVRRIDCNFTIKMKIKRDIIETLEERSLETGIEDPTLLMGTIEEVSSEFIENLDIYKNKSKDIISSKTIMGLPLYCITSNYNVIAKGIFACGPKAVGVISIGGVCAGLISFGGISVGVISLGGIALGALTALGGIAVAYDMALGGIAIANSLSIGGLAIAHDVAVGGFTIGKLMGYTQGYTIPHSLDESSVVSFKMPIYSDDFKRVFYEMNFKFGFIKRWIIDMLNYK